MQYVNSLEKTLHAPKSDKNISNFAALPNLIFFFYLRLKRTYPQREFSVKLGMSLSKCIPSLIQ